MIDDEWNEKLLTAMGITDPELRKSVLDLGSARDALEKRMFNTQGFNTNLAKSMLIEMARAKTVEAARHFKDHVCNCAIINNGQGPKCSSCQLRESLEVLDYLEKL
jgi:hypothetical protein